jgi:hypothetical protein
MIRDAIPHAATALAQRLVDSGRVDCERDAFDDFTLELADAMISAQSIGADVVTGTFEVDGVERIVSQIQASRALSRIVGTVAELNAMVEEVMKPFNTLDAARHSQIDRAISGFERGTVAFSLAYAQSAMR